MRLGDDDFLLDHIGAGFHLLVFTTTALPAGVQQVVQAARQRGVPLRVLAIGATQPVAGADAHLPDATGQVRLRYAVPADGAAYLLRPDQHVCARWLALDAERLQTALATALPA